MAAEEKALRHLNELARAHRVSMLGEMVSSLVHELGQPLVVITNFAMVARHAAQALAGEKRQALLDALGHISDHAHRAAQITRHYRDFVRRADSPCVSTDLNQLARNVEHLLQIEARMYCAEVELVLDPSLPEVIADPIQIEQVLINLVKNAMEAVAGMPDGRRNVTLRTARGPDDTIEITVSDTGAGISAEDLDRLFQPFFTTKSDGMGMGLSISRSIARAHGGRLEAANRPDGGATFHFLLPIPLSQETSS
jgi:C4-dicarboxylate-specific signal transduction histidine kinase